MSEATIKLREVDVKTLTVRCRMAVLGWPATTCSSALECLTVLRCARSPLTAMELANEMGVGKGAVIHLLNRMRTIGMVKAHRPDHPTRRALRYSPGY